MVKANLSTTKSSNLRRLANTVCKETHTLAELMKCPRKHVAHILLNQQNLPDQKPWATPKAWRCEKCRGWHPGKKCFKGEKPCL